MKFIQAVTLHWFWDGWQVAVQPVTVRKQGMSQLKTEVMPPLRVLRRRQASVLTVI